MTPATTVRPLPWWLRDARHLRVAALVFAVAAAGAVGAVAWTRALWHEARNRQVQAEHARNLARRQFAQVGQEKRDIAVFQPLYRQLQAQGLVGRENRLDWLAALRRIQDQYGLGPITYDIAPRQPVVVSPAMELGRYQLYATPMRLQMELLHEGDLFTLLAGLRALGHGTVQECTLKRLAAAPNAPLAPTVSAACTLNWVTLAGEPAAAAVTPATAAAPSSTRPMELPPLGRLFTAAPQRAQLDTRRHGGPQNAAIAETSPPPAAPPAPQVLNGVLRPTHGNATVWLNNEPLPEAQRMVRRDGTVTLTLPSGQHITLKPGQRYDATSGEVRDAGQ